MPASDKQRRQAERRRLQRQAQRRREQAARRRQFQIWGSVAGALILVAVIVVVVVMGSDDSSTQAGKPNGTPTTSASPTTSPSTSPTASASKAPFGTCTWTKTGTAARTVSVPSTTKPPHTGTVTMAVATTQGAMTFTLNRAKAPCAAESFVSLAAQKYFDKTPCHRLTTGTLNVLQCGDPTGTGTGGPGYSFGDELTGSEEYTTGVLAMANSGVNTNGSQFFIVYKSSQLGPNYTIFGTVSSGLSVVDKVAAAGSTPAQDGKPKLPISLTTVRQQT